MLEKKLQPKIQYTFNLTHSDKNNKQFKNDDYNYHMTTFTGKVVLYNKGGEKWG